MEHFPRSDVEQIVKLLSQVGDPTAAWTFSERKRLLMEGMVQLVEADMWYLGAAVVKTGPPDDAMPVTFIDGGWADDAQRLKFFQLVTNPEISGHAQRRCFEVHRSQVHRTLFGHEILTEDEDQWSFLQLWRDAGIDSVMLSMYPVNRDILNCLGVYRGTGRPPFSERDRAVVHLIFEQAEWVHRDGAEIRAGTAVLKLAPRERQVLILLLSGDSQKEVSQKLGLSVHTVGDYVKSIYRQFKVTSRSQLLALFMTGGPGRFPRRP